MRKPIFKQITTVTVSDILTGNPIPIIHAVDEDGEIWQRIGFEKTWDRITKPSDFGDAREEG